MRGPIDDAHAAFAEDPENETRLAVLEQEASAERVGMIGHVATLYRQQKDPEKRKITVPVRKE